MKIRPTTDGVWTMRIALYYPHTVIQRESLLRAALLLWDHVEVIIPWPGYQPRYDDRTMAEAFELIGRLHLPSERAKTEAHRKVLTFIQESIPSPFIYKTEEPGYDIYPEKLLPETWHALAELRLVRTAALGEKELTRSMGLALMNILADCCAGKTRARITDERDAYRNIMTILSADRRRVDNDNENREFLVSRLVRVLDTDLIPLRNLIEFRKREERESKGSDLRALRHRYCEHIEKYVKEMNQLEDPSDLQELRRQYVQDAQYDVASLKQELKFARSNAFFTKEFLSVAVIGEPLFLWLKTRHLLSPTFTGIGAGITAIGGLLGVRNRYLQSRREILNRHPMAYLYETQRHAGSRFRLMHSSRNAGLRRQS